jgi:heat-inducible transcriptional repressor
LTSANRDKRIEERKRADMELDDRKVKILKAIIKNYLETGEPVGSRTISKYADLKLSSATIRNEMADLEEMGYIVQPHTSAGRIPTDKGYRFYVDDMMLQKENDLVNREQLVADWEKELKSMRDFLSQKVDRVEELLQNVAKALAKDTNYATMVSAPQVRGNKLKFVQLSQLETNEILAVIVMEGNVIRNKVITVSEELSQENLLKLNILLNTSLTGLSLQEMNLSIVSKMENQAGEHMQLVKEVVDAVVETISSEDNLKIYTSGATNIFKYPELSDSSKASELIYALEEKQSLTDFVKIEEDEEQSNSGIQVYIGNEAPVESMKDCSVVTATYELQDGMRGTIGIIGPKRMDYDKVVEKLKTIQTQLDDVFKKT